MKGYLHDISEQAIENNNFRKVLQTGKYTQIVLMSIPAGGEIGSEVHEDTDQVLYFAAGKGKAILDGKEKEIGKDDVVLVHAGTTHNFVNTGEEDLKVVTAYSPPHHPDGTIHKTKEEADQAEY